MKQWIHKILSISMALLVLFSTVSFTVEKHYCGEHLIDVAVFTGAEDCSGEKISETKTTKKGCCKDEIDVLEGQDELRVNGIDYLEFEQQLFVASFVYSYINLFEGLPQLVIPHRDYSPPNLIIDRQVLDQVFLI
jgi:hypothetical protein